MASFWRSCSKWLEGCLWWRTALFFSCTASRQWNCVWFQFIFDHCVGSFNCLLFGGNQIFVRINYMLKITANALEKKTKWFDLPPQCFPRNIDLFSFELTTQIMKQLINIIQINQMNANSEIHCIFNKFISFCFCFFLQVSAISWLVLQWKDCISTIPSIRANR